MASGVEVRRTVSGVRLAVTVTGIILTLVAAALLGLAYTARLNPEIAWLRALDAAKTGAVERAAGEPAVLFSAGSSVTFGVDAAQLSKATGRPVINLGLHAGLGGAAIMAYAEAKAKRGDLIILSLENELLTTDPPVGRLARAWAVADGHPRAAFGQVTPFTLLEAGKSVMEAASPGLQQLVNHAVKLALRLPTYKYSISGIDAYGDETVRVAGSEPDKPLQTRIASGWVGRLAAFRDRLSARGVGVVYMLPWRLHAPTPANLQAMTAYLQSINTVLPVALTRNCGLQTQPTWFADTRLHLSDAGASARANELAEVLLHLSSHIAPSNARLTLGCASYAR